MRPLRIASDTFYFRARFTILDARRIHAILNAPSVQGFAIRRHPSKIIFAGVKLELMQIVSPNGVTRGKSGRTAQQARC